MAVRSRAWMLVPILALAFVVQGWLERPTEAELPQPPPVGRPRPEIANPYRCREAVAFLKQEYGARKRRMKFVGPDSREFSLELAGVNEYTSRPDRGQVPVQVWTVDSRRVGGKADVWVGGLDTGRLRISKVVLRQRNVERVFLPRRSDEFVAVAGHAIAPPADKNLVRRRHGTPGLPRATGTSGILGRSGASGSAESSRDREGSAGKSRAW